MTSAQRMAIRLAAPTTVVVAASVAVTIMMNHVVHSSALRISLRFLHIIALAFFVVYFFKRVFAIAEAQRGESSKER